MSAISATTATAHTAAAAAAATNSTNSLLAVTNAPLNGLTHAESTMIRLVNSISNESLVIDIRHLNDPDSLWKRKKHA